LASARRWRSARAVAKSWVVSRDNSRWSEVSRDGDSWREVRVNAVGVRGHAGGAMSGWRGRIGGIYPSDGLLDAEFWQCVPQGVSVHVTRSLTGVNLDPSLSPSQRHAVMAESKDLEAAASTFSLIEPGCVAYACTAASFTRGVGHDAEIIKRIEAASGT